jgi:hypothetical protein
MHALLEELTLKNEPGSVYMATMCGAKHCVSHREEPQTLVNIAGLGDVKVVVLLRSNVMRYSRGPITPNPTALLQIATEVLNTWMLAHPLQLPTLVECHKAAGAAEGAKILKQA